MSILEYRCSLFSGRPTIRHKIESEMFYGENIILATTLKESTSIAPFQCRFLVTPAGKVFLQRTESRKPKLCGVGAKLMRDK